MKYAFAAAALVATVTAQSLSDIPSCAIPCIDAARTSTTTCTETDYTCICDNINPLTTAATPCVLTDCGATVAATEVLPAVQAFCAAVSASATAASSTAVATTAETTAATTAATTEATTAVTTAAGTTAAGTTAVYTTSAAASSTLVASSYPVYSTSAASNATSTKSSPTSVVTAGAAMATAGSIGMILLGALAAL